MCVDLKMIEEARQRLNGVIRKTELYKSDGFSRMTGMNIFFKTENRQKQVPLK